VNIFGGFVVSQRMLNLFKKPGEKDFSPLMLLPGFVFLVVALMRPELLKAVSTVSALLCVAACSGWPERCWPPSCPSALTTRPPQASS